MTTSPEQATETQDTSPEEASAPTDLLGSVHTKNFPDMLRQLNVSIAVSTCIATTSFP